MAQVALGAATTVSTDPTPTALPTLRQWEASTPGLVTDPALAARLDQSLVGVDGHVSVAVKDLGSGRGAALDGDREMPSASLYKLPVLYSVFEAGLNLGEELPITQEDVRLRLEPGCALPPGPTAPARGLFLVSVEYK